jgi:hypothetical protein
MRVRGFIQGEDIKKPVGGEEAYPQVLFLLFELSSKRFSLQGTNLMRYACAIV